MIPCHRTRHWVFNHAIRERLLSIFSHNWNYDKWEYLNSMVSWVLNCGEKVYSENAFIPSPSWELMFTVRKPYQCIDFSFYLALLPFFCHFYYSETIPMHRFLFLFGTFTPPGWLSGERVGLMTMVVVSSIPG